MKKKFFLLIAFLLCFALMNNLHCFAESLTAEQILEKVDQNYDTGEGRIGIVTIIVKEKRATRTLISKIWTKGHGKSFTQFLSPARERGSKMLKLEDELWISSPNTDRIIKLAGHMLRQSMMGTDLSYEDFMEDPTFNNIYNAEILGEEVVLDRPCYIVKMTAKKGKKVVYYARKAWIDKERFLGLKEELYAKGGKLLKKQRIEEVFNVKGRWFPKKLHLKDMMKEGEGSQMIFDSLKLDVEIPKHVFTKANLRG